MRLAKLCTCNSGASSSCCATESFIPSPNSSYQHLELLLYNLSLWLFAPFVRLVSVSETLWVLWFVWLESNLMLNCWSLVLNCWFLVLSYWFYILVFMLALNIMAVISMKMIESMICNNQILIHEQS